jgi:hypothetical protein
MTSTPLGFIMSVAAGIRAIAVHAVNRSIMPPQIIIWPRYNHDRRCSVFVVGSRRRRPIAIHTRRRIDVTFLGRRTGIVIRRGWLDCRSSSRSAKLICRPTGRATAQLREENRRPQASSAAHPAADGIDRLLAANHLSNERHRASTWQVKTSHEKPSEMPIPPYYFAFRDRN